MVYLIPGLGADGRIFAGLELGQPTQIIDWLVPTADELLSAYAGRLAAIIPAEEPCALVGVSFGGIIALEIAQLRPLAQVILVSSVAQPTQLPQLVRLARTTGLHRLLPFWAAGLMQGLMSWLFGVKTPAHRQLLRQILRDTDPFFARWAVQQLVRWPGVARVSSQRIHGSHDRLLPLLGPVDYVVEGGGHLMILTHASEVGAVLAQYLLGAC